MKDWFRPVVVQRRCNGGHRSVFRLIVRLPLLNMKTIFMLMIRENVEHC